MAFGDPYISSNTTGAPVNTTWNSPSMHSSGQAWDVNAKFPAYSSHRPTVAFPCADGHRTKDTVLEYDDGTLLSQCDICGERIEIARYPGGISVVRLQELLAQVRNNPHGSDHLAELVALREALVVEKEALESAELILEMVVQSMGSD